MNGWREVTKSNPCPICNHTDWCSVSEDGGVCVCRRIQSEKQTKGGGWIHFLKDSDKNRFFVSMDDRQKAKEKELREKLERALRCRSYFDSLPHSIGGSHPVDDDLQIMLCRNLARNLGLPEYPFFELDVRWDASNRSAAFPMRNADGDVTGIRYRVLATGRKFSLKGSVDGLFYCPNDFVGNVEDLFVCEGPTDWAALHACGFINSVGRSSCSSGADMIAAICKRHNVKRVIIFADADRDRVRENGRIWNPGIDGATRLGEYLNRPHLLVFPPAPHKDLRDWYRNGAMTAHKVQLLVNSATEKIKSKN